MLQKGNPPAPCVNSARRRLCGLRPRCRKLLHPRPICGILGQMWFSAFRAVPIALVLAAASVSGPVTAAPCRLGLALGFDVSRSVDDRAYAIQIEGILAALADPEVRAALLTPGRPVALAVYEWSGERQQTVISSWMLMLAPADIDLVADRVAGHRRSPDNWYTGVGAALAFGHRLLSQVEHCDFRTLDLSGDGRNNHGPDPAQVYRRLDFDGITVNGLAIEGIERDIAAWYAREVIRGPGAFVEVARSADDFPAAFRRKLLRELSAPLFGALARPGQAASSPASARSISDTVSATP
jgi:hypothetical protein